MIKKLAWDTFKNTGNINTFLELLEVQKMESNLSTQGNLGVGINSKENGLSNNVSKNYNTTDINNSPIKNK